jgi:hypothetical protein
MKWVTRERPQVDRIACPWLIKRFVDPEAEFLYAPRDKVLAVAEREGATPYDVPDAELGHHGDEPKRGDCTAPSLPSRCEKSSASGLTHSRAASVAIDTELHTD